MILKNASNAPHSATDRDGPADAGHEAQVDGRPTEAAAEGSATDKEVDEPMAISQTLTGGAMPRARAKRTPARPATGSSLAALFREHHEAVYRAAWRVTGDAQDAEDVLQTVFLRLARSAERVAPDNPGGYLHRSAINAALDLVRSRHRRPAIGIETPGGMRMATDAARGTANVDGAQERDGGAEASELSARLRMALSELHPRMAEAFVLRYIEGFGNQEIATLLGTTENTIGVTLHRARQQLRDKLRPSEGEQTDG